MQRRIVGGMILNYEAGDGVHNLQIQGRRFISIKKEALEMVIGRIFDTKALEGNYLKFQKLQLMMLVINDDLLQWPVSQSSLENCGTQEKTFDNITQ